MICYFCRGLGCSRRLSLGPRVCWGAPKCCRLQLLILLKHGTVRAKEVLCNGQLLTTSPVNYFPASCGSNFSRDGPGCCTQLDPRVIRIPIVPGSDPRVCYGDLVGRGVRGIVLEAFGVGNMPDTVASGWLPWLRDQTKKGLQVRLAGAEVQCSQSNLKEAQSSFCFVRDVCAVVYPLLALHQYAMYLLLSLVASVLLAAAYSFSFAVSFEACLHAIVCAGVHPPV